MHSACTWRAYPAIWGSSECRVYSWARRSRDEGRACRVLEADDWCRRCGCQGSPRDTVTRRLAHESLGWRPTTLLVRVRRYRCTGCGHVWRLTRDANGQGHARGCWTSFPAAPGEAYADWLTARGEAFRDGIEVATLDPFHGYKNAIDDQLEDAVAVLDAFHVVKLGTDAVDQVPPPRPAGHPRAPRPQERPALRDPDHPALRAGTSSPTSSRPGWTGDPRRRAARRSPHGLAMRPTTPLGPRREGLTEGRMIAEKVLASFPSCPIPEIARLGRTLKQWKAAFLAYFETGRANNGGTEAINGLIELHRRIARGFRNGANYRLRMLLIAADSTHVPTPSKKSQIGEGGGSEGPGQAAMNSRRRTGVVRADPREARQETEADCGATSCGR